MRSVSLDRVVPQIARLAYRLRIAVSALALGLTIGAARTRALDIDNMDGLITDTIASRDRMPLWNSVRGSGGDSSVTRPDGIRMGSFVVSPEAGAIVTFDDNVFAHDIDKQSDWRTDTGGSVTFKSDLPRHQLDFSLDGKIVNYENHTGLNYANLRANVQGALHFDSAHTLSASILSALEHEERTDPTYPLTAAGPVGLFHNRAAVGITRDVGRLYGTIAATAESWNYGDVHAINGSLLDRDARDTIAYSTQLRTGYRISPGFDFVTKLRGYRLENAGTPNLDRDAWGFEAMAGLAFETDPLLRWHILGGYGTRDFDMAGLSNFSSTLLEADVQWLPTQKLTIYASVSQQILEETDGASSAIVELGGQVHAEYEIYHNLVLTGGLEVRQDDFKGTSRSDLLYSARTGLEYFFTKNWLFTFGYEHQVRDSSEDANDMHRNRFMFGAKLRF
jgi:hypothetical protein